MLRTKLIIIFFKIASILTFDYASFKSEYCEEKAEIEIYNILDKKPANVSGVLCQNFTLIDQVLNEFPIESEIFYETSILVLKNCKLAYFHIYFMEKFPTTSELYMENCTISLKNPVLMIEQGKHTSLTQFSCFKCIITENINTKAFEKFPKLTNFYIIDSKLQNISGNNESFLIKNSSLDRIVLTQNKIKNLPEDFLLSSKSLKILRLNGNNLEKFPSCKGSSLLELNLSHNSIRLLPTVLDSLENQTNLQEYRVDHNHIKIDKILYKHFKELTKLSTINMSENSQIQAIEENAFQDLKSLESLEMFSCGLVELETLGAKNVKYIDFSKNRIKTLKGSVFANMSALETLLLNNNELGNIQDESFKDLSSLKYINLSSNKLQTLHGKIFKGLQSVKELWLQNSGIKNVEGNVFGFLINLEKLILSRNYLSNIPELPSSLKMLDFSRNSISIISSNNFANLVNLTTLDLSYSNGSWIFSKESFSPLIRLENLIFQGNKLREISGIYLPGRLKMLDLSYNLIRSVKRDDFPGSPLIAELILRGNRILVIDPTFPDVFKNLTYVDYRGNPLVNVDKM